MKEQFVAYEIASRLKEVGFDEECMAYYKLECTGENTLLSEFILDHSKTVFYTQTNNNREISAPLWQQAIDWIRDVHKIHLEFVYSQDHNKYSWSGWDEYHWRELSKRPRVEGRFPYPYKSRFKEHYWNHKTYEEAREESILKTLELLKNYANENSI